MAVFSIIQKSQLEGAKRLDAEYYQPEYLEIAKRLQSIPHETLESAAEQLVSFGAYALTSIIEWQESGIPFITAENLKDGFIDYGSVRYISEEVDEVLKKSRVKEGQVLLAMSGSVGNAAVAVKIPERLNSNQDIVKITPRAGISPYVLAAFLNSRYGRMQVLRLPVGSIQQHIFLWQMQTLLVPTIGSKQAGIIEQLYKDGLHEMEKSKSLYSQAEQILLEELGLQHFEADGDLWNVVNLSEVKAAGRMDAEYFQRKYKKLVSKLSKYGTRRFPDTLQSVAATFVPQPDKTYRYVELANINASIGIIDGYTELLGKEAPSRARRLLKVGDVIVSSVQGSLGKVALVGREHAGDIASTGFFQFRSAEILPEVLLVLAQSMVLRYQMEQRCAGTILTAVPKESIKDILVPTLPEKTQQRIAELVRESHAARAKAGELLASAKRTVEEWVESRRT